MPELATFAEQLSRAAEQVLTPEALLNTGILTAVAGFAGRLAWSVGTALVSWIHSRRLRVMSRHTIALARRQLPFDHQILKPRCLIIRYGTDRYIERLASDRDRQDGRLQNRVIDVPIEVNDDGSTTFRLRVPVHKRLGTQFKCFADVQDASKIDEVMVFLSNCENVVSPDRSSSPLHPHRIFFLLRAFDVVESVDGHSNNMCLPE